MEEVSARGSKNAGKKPGENPRRRKRGDQPVGSPSATRVILGEVLSQILPN